jgi:hypothetical protein
MFYEESPTNNIKTILLAEPTKKPRSSHKGEQSPPKQEKSKRVVTTTKLWNFSPHELSHEYQREVLIQMNPLSGSSSTSSQDHPHTHIIKFIHGEIQKKIYGYKCQDLKKEMFSPFDFVKMENIIQKLKDCNLTCYYCKEPIYILYEFVREPHQWTLERINNAEGHINTNTEIACLKCNLSRRCIFHERYLFTKQISNIVKENIDNTP